MLKTKDIIDEFDNRLRKTSKEITFPLSKEEKEKIDLMMEYLLNSQNEELSEKYDLRPGMGLSAIQIGIDKRVFVMAYELEDGTFKERVIINPKIISHSKEKIYIEEGEGCLSINRPVLGIVPRYARVKLEYYDIDGNKKKEKFREEESVIVLHEIDHLNGILFIDHIDEDNPYKDKDLYRAI